VRHLLTRPDTIVYALCRSPDTANDLRAEVQHGLRLRVLPVDVRDEGQIAAAAAAVQREHGRVDFLINCAGILNLEGKGETSIQAVDSSSFLATVQTNALGPLLMAKHFVPMMARKAGTGDKDHAVMASISARVGSISDNKLGGWYSYRMSKAALNMLTRSLAHELVRKKVLCVSLHPGTVATAFSARYHGHVQHEIFTVDECVQRLSATLGALTMADTGGFFAYDGKAIPY